MKEFKGTKSKWQSGKTPSEPKGRRGIRYFVFAPVIDFNERKRDDRFIYNQFLAKTESVDYHNEAYYNSLLIAAAPDLLEALIEAQKLICSLKLSMLAHPDCEKESEFDDCTTSAQEMEDKIELVVNNALGIK